VRRHRRSSGDDLPIRAEVNVTSLVDIAFVLLIIFVITAPILAGGVEVNLPRGDVQPLNADEKPFYVTVKRDGSVFVEDTPMTMGQFEKSFGQLAAAGRFERVYIRADSLAAYGAITHVFTTIAKTGKQFSFVVEDVPSAP
jgi:biopolymer transport protein TolR